MNDLRKKVIKLAHEAGPGELRDKLMPLLKTAAGPVARLRTWGDHARMMIKHDPESAQFFTLLDGNLGLLARICETVGAKQLGKTLRHAARQAESESALRYQGRTGHEKQAAVTGDRGAALRTQRNGINDVIKILRRIRGGAEKLDDDDSKALAKKCTELVRMFMDENARVKKILAGD